MSDQSSNSGPRQSKLDSEFDPRNENRGGTDNQNGPDVHLGYVPKYGKGGLYKHGITDRLDPKVYSDQDHSHREKVAASTPFMPQAGKPAGTHKNMADNPDQSFEVYPNNSRHENVAASTPFMPQAGKPTGN
ncbi:hypothetical protein N7466_003146 [Penicillium verhagenii]|uniref:uncharacterized protein n=1 Tax=Penicillium verhagenii TaxID=1562060 RepID=UPI0025459B95|nr:uncharacterized protein N7466_003146 [Penicillium verhagenii]KAJ5936696.1 hypothetical protein N7466_003146 [Penicillium verhagenii]